MTRLPLEYDGSIRGAAQFRAKACPHKAICDRDGLHNNNDVIFCGELIVVFTQTPAEYLFTENRHERLIGRAYLQPNNIMEA